MPLKCKNKNNQVVCIGIDESYKDTGITVNYNNGEKVECYSIKAKDKYKVKTEYRNLIRARLRKILSRVLHEEEVIIVVERIRQFSSRFISMDYIKAMSALIAVIVDEAYKNSISVYSVDTRNWKANIVGTSKPLKNDKGIDPKKYPTYLWCISYGYKEEVIEEGKYNDNIGDSICLSYAWWNSSCKSKLKLES